MIDPHGIGSYMRKREILRIPDRWQTADTLVEAHQPLQIVGIRRSETRFLVSAFCALLTNKIKLQRGIVGLPVHPHSSAAIVENLRDAGIGQISEIFDGDYPQR